MNTKYYKDTVESMKLHYEADNSVVINNTCFDVTENVKFNTSDILQNCNDVKLNNYNCLCLTNTQQLTTNTTQQTTQQDTFSFTTYFKNISIGKDNYGKYLSLISVGNNKQLTYTDILDDSAIFQCVCSDENLNIYKYDDITQTTYNIDVIGHAVSTKTPSSFSYIISEDTLQLFVVTKTINQTFGIQRLPSNIEYTNATSRYDNVSGGILSAFENHSNNYILNTQYSTCTGDVLSCNLLTLDNQYSYTNNLAPVTNWIGDNLHTVKTLQTGTWQEHGNTHVYNVKEFYTYDIKIAPGTTTFTTPKTLYPYDTIDINDTTFVKCGAVGGDNPVIADRIYSNRYTNIEDNKILLCTWLSSNNVSAIWVDRYYNPTLINQADALKSNADKIVFDTLESNLKLLTCGYFDKQSDLVIKPNQELTYYHVTQRDFESYIKQQHPQQFNTLKCYNPDGLLLYSSDEISLTGNAYVMQNVNTSINNNFALSFNMNMFDWIDTQYYELFTSQSNNCGIRIYKDIPITPVLMTYKIDNNSTTIRVLNTDFKTIDEFNIEGVAKNIFRPNNLEFIVVQFDNKVDVYNIFGTHLHTFEGDIESCYYNNPYLYILYNDSTVVSNTPKLTIHKYNIYTFEEQDTIVYNTNVDNISNIVYENGDLWVNTNIYKPQNFAYVENYGVFSLFLSGMGDETIPDELIDGDININPNNIPVSSDGKNGVLMLNVGGNDINTLTKSDTKYFAVHSNEYTDYVQRLHFVHHDINDFAIYQDTMYFTTNEYLFVSDLNRTNISKFKLPIHTSNTTDKTNLVVTCELIDNKFTQQVFVLISNKSQDAVEVYKFENEIFSKITTLNLPEFNLYQMTGKTYIPKFNNSLQFDIQYKIGDNKIIKYSSPIKDIPTGNHTILINIDNTSHNVELYVDDVLNTNITLNDNYIVHYNILQNNIMFGNTLLYNGANLATYTHKSNYLLKDVNISNITIFNTPVTNTTVKVNTLLNDTTPTLTFGLPCGQRCNISKINNIYKHSVPGYKSTNFDIIVKNLKLSDKNQSILSNLIKQYIQKYIPVITNLDNISYKNY